MTRIITVNPLDFTDEELIEAAELIREGDLVAFPTETVYGLGADATNSEAINKIFLTKNRPSDNPLIVHVSNGEMLKKCVEEIPDFAKKLIERFWPGPLTLVLKKSDYLSPNVTKGLETVAIRSPNHPIAIRLIEMAKRPIAAPSANLSGRPSPTSAEHVLEDLEDRIPLIIDGGNTEVGLESTVVSVVSNPPILLRPGGITLEELLEVVPTLQTRAESEMKKLSPGTRYTHYSPKKQVILLAGFKSEEEIDQFLNNIPEYFILLCTNSTHNHSSKIPVKLIGKTKKEIQRGLFANLRSLDTGPYDCAYIEEVENTDEGLAIMNRLTKASSKVINPSM